MRGSECQTTNGGDAQLLCLSRGQLVHLLRRKNGSCSQKLGSGLRPQMAVAHNDYVSPEANWSNLRLKNERRPRIETKMQTHTIDCRVSKDTTRQTICDRVPGKQNHDPTDEHLSHSTIAG